MDIQVTHRSLERMKIVVSTTPQDVRIRDGLQGLDVFIEGGISAGTPGGPALSEISFEVALPAGTAVGSVSGERPGEPILLREKAVVRPVQLPAPGSCRRSNPRMRDDGLVQAWPVPRPVPPDPELYRRAYGEAQPSAEAVSADHSGPNSITRLIVRPLTLREDGALLLHSKLEVSLTLTSADLADLAQSKRLRFYSRQQAQRWTELSASRVINASDVLKVGDHFGFLAHTDYLVITSNNTWDATAIAARGSIGDMVSEFERLAAWKRTKGLSARVVTIDDIVAGKFGIFTGKCRRDLPEVLREFIKWAYRTWGVTWLLLGGDSSVLPVRNVVGYAGGITPGATNPPADGQSFWTGSLLRLHTTAPIDDLIRTSDGLRLHHGTSTGGSTPSWSYATDETYSQTSPTATAFVRVEGPASDLSNEELFILNHDNAIPTDLYYSTVAGYVATGADPLYFCNSRTGVLGSRCSTRDWDWQNNGLYGQYNDNGDLGGQTYTADISVGRALVAGAGTAAAFVDKVIHYESPGLFSGQWTRKLLMVSSNWGGRTGIGAANTLQDNTYVHVAAADHTVIQLSEAPASLATRVIAVAADGTETVLTYNLDAAAAHTGWTYVRSASDMSASVTQIWVPWGAPIKIALPSRWIAVYDAANLAPSSYVIDDSAADGSMTDQETLRRQLALAVPGWSNIDRLYEDDVDLDPVDRAAAPLAHLTGTALKTRLDGGPHMVSLSGHGNWWGCCGLSPALNDQLTNATTPFIGYADSCLTNEFDLTYSIAEDLVSNVHGGAVAYVGNSRFSWIGVGDDFQRNFFGGLPATTAIGILHDRRCACASISTGFYRRYNYWSIFALNLAGDPEMRIRTRPLPFPCIIVEKTARFDRPYVVHVKKDELPVRDAAVTVNAGEWRTQAFTDEDGAASLDLSGAPLGEISITVNHVDLMPATELAEIIGPVWREARVLSIDTGHAGVTAQVEWNDMEYLVRISPCAAVPLLQVFAIALTSARRLRLSVVQEAGGPVVEAATLISGSVES